MATELELLRRQHDLTNQMMTLRSRIENHIWDDPFTDEPLGRTQVRIDMRKDLEKLETEYCLINQQLAKKYESKKTKKD